MDPDGKNTKLGSTFTVLNQLKQDVLAISTSTVKLGDLVHRIQEYIAALRQEIADTQQQDENTRKLGVQVDVIARSFEEFKCELTVVTDRSKSVNTNSSELSESLFGFITHDNHDTSQEITDDVTDDVTDDITDDVIDDDVTDEEPMAETDKEASESNKIKQEKVVTGSARDPISVDVSLFRLTSVTPISSPDFSPAPGGTNRRPSTRQNCDRCGRTFRSLTSLAAHFRANTCQAPDPEPPAQGDDDEVEVTKAQVKGKRRRFKVTKRKKPVLRSAREEEEGERQVKDENSESSCAHCDVKFTDNSALQSHLVDTHPDLVKPEKDAPIKVTPSKVTTKKVAGKKVTTPKQTSEVHACDTCNRNYPSLYLLKQHSRMHGRVFKCGECNKTFDKMNTYNVHIKMHKGEVFAFPCKQCDCAYKSQFKLDKHLKQVHEGIMDFVCNICNNRFDEASKLRTHFYTHPETMPLTCSICEERFSGLVEKKAHLETVHELDYAISSDLKCELCEEKFGHEVELTDHIRTHIPLNPFHCGSCSKSYSDYYSLRKHMKNHSGLRPFQCDQCTKCFMHEENLRHHQRMHETGEKPFKCKQAGCDKAFVNPSSLTHHSKVHHDNGKVHACHECAFKFTHARALAKHLLTHKDLRPYLCEECGASYRQKDTLRKHVMNDHTGERPYKCKTCGAAFVRLQYLQYHERRKHTHVGEKPWICEICGSSFTWVTSLKHHKLIHTGERPYPCQECTMAFRDKKSLSRHMQTHTGEKPHKCDACGKCFAEKYNLQCHQRSAHTGEKPYSCKHCHLAFAHRVTKSHKRSCWPEFRVEGAKHRRGPSGLQGITGGAGGGGPSIAGGGEHSITGGGGPSLAGGGGPSLARETPNRLEAAVIAAQRTYAEQLAAAGKMSVTPTKMEGAAVNNQQPMTSQHMVNTSSVVAQERYSTAPAPTPLNMTRTPMDIPQMQQSLRFMTSEQVGNPAPVDMDKRDLNAAAALNYMSSYPMYPFLRSLDQAQ